ASARAPAPRSEAPGPLPRPRLVRESGAPPRPAARAVAGLSPRPQTARAPLPSGARAVSGCKVSLLLVLTGFGRRFGAQSLQLCGLGEVHEASGNDLCGASTEGPGNVRSGELQVLGNHRHRLLLLVAQAHELAEPLGGEIRGVLDGHQHIADR